MKRTGWRVIMMMIVMTTEKVRGTLRPGEFMAGSFILTQSALDEAPHRYSSFINNALEKMEMKDPPSKSDEENCAVKYRIEPSGRRHQLDIQDKTLSLKLQSNNTVVVSATVDVAVHARTWIWKGVNFGFLGCMKITSCGGHVVTYSAQIDMKISFKVDWDHDEKKIKVQIKPVDTELRNVNVNGCRPPWYLWWFKQWQDMLNAGVQDAFQQFADNYSHELTVPTEVAFHNNIFVSYKVTNLKWDQKFVAFEASATFKALIGGKNKTFFPEQKSGLNAGIPTGKWPKQSASDSQSFLLQGVRLSSQFLNSIMWYASITNSTEYHGNTTVLDSQINGTIRYTPPLLSVSKRGANADRHVLNITIPNGLLLATCKPIQGKGSGNDADSKILFKAEFNDLAGSGNVKLAETKRIGLIIEIVDLDLSDMKTKPFEPKLPLPLTFESELMKSGISQLRPIMNAYLKEKPIFLPEKVEPLVAFPEVFLTQTDGGLGYAQILSYCTCSDFQGIGAFSRCDDRSDLCTKKESGRKKRSVNGSDTIRVRRGTSKGKRINQVEYDNNRFARSGNTIERVAEPLALKSEDNLVELPQVAKWLNGSTTFHKVIDLANDFIENNFVGEEENQTSTTAKPIFVIPKSSREIDLTIYLTKFESGENCSLSNPGETAMTYMLRYKPFCSEIMLGKNSLNQWYVFKPDGKKINFGCTKHCRDCDFLIDITEETLGSEKCILINNRDVYSHFVVSHKPNFIERKIQANNGTSAVTQFYNTNGNCNPAQQFDKSVLATVVSRTFHLGMENSGCLKTDDALYVAVQRKNNSLTDLAWSCTNHCFSCSFHLEQIMEGECRLHKEIIPSLMKYTKAKLIVPQSLVIRKQNDEKLFLIALVVSLSAVTVFGILLTVACIWCMKTSKNGEKRWKNTALKYAENVTGLFSFLCEGIISFGKTHIGLRFRGWKKEEWKTILEDIFQNCLLIINGVLAIAFAFEWNSPNNPLLLFSTKLGSKIGNNTAGKIFEMSKILELEQTLNFWTYIVNIVNGVLAFVIVIIWCVSKSGSRQRWTKLRLFSSSSMLVSILLTIAIIVFTTYFKDLATLKTNTGYFITDNAKMRKIVEGILHVSLSGVSLTVISFTFVFLFHGVGGGLYSGTVLFRILHLHSKKENLEILTTLLVILTIIQPFICLHPVIIWSQDSKANALYLVLTIFIWFLPLSIHLLVKTIVNQINERYKDKVKRPESENIQTELAPLNNNKKGKKRANISSQTSLLSNRKTELTPPRKTTSQALGKRKSKLAFQTSFSGERNADKGAPVASETSPHSAAKGKKVIRIVDMTMQVTQLVIYLTSFSFITHHIINTELNAERHNLKKFVLPAIISVFVWMLSISYFLLSLVLNSTEEAPLVFKDMLQNSLRKRLSFLDKRHTVAGGARNPNGLFHPSRPAPLPPQFNRVEKLASNGKRPQTLPVTPYGKRPQTLPTMELAAKNKVKPDIPLKPKVPPKPSKTAIAQFKASQNINSMTNEMETNFGEMKPKKEKGVVFSSSSNDDSAEDEVQVTLSEIFEIEDEDEEIEPSCCSKFLDYVLERTEYKYPEEHGWRIKFRRIFLNLGVIAFTYTTLDTFIATQNYSSKDEIQKILNYAGTNLTWPENEKSVLDDVFELYNQTQQRKSYVMIAATVLFWSSVIMDLLTYRSNKKSFKQLGVMGGRVVNFIASLLVFASVILVGLPDYLAASNLNQICPFCGEDFNRTVQQVAEFSIGLIFACIFTFQLLPVLLTIPPALVRASVIILIHPEWMKRDDKTTVLRMSILQQVIIVSSVLSFPITFVSMCIIDQQQKNIFTTIIVLLFWTIPPLILYIGLHYSKKLKKYKILLLWYYMYNTAYFGLILALVLYSLKNQLTTEAVLQLLQSLMESPSIWFGTMSQIFLCNVVISDLLYMTVF